MLDTPNIPTSTPIYSSNPTYDEWIFWDQLTRGHITLDCTDIASLGVLTTGTAKDAWDLIQMEWGKSTNMRRSHAQEILDRTTYTEGTEIQEHIKLLQTQKVAIDNLSTSVMNNETWRGIIIWSIPPTPKWLPAIPLLYTMSSLADIMSTLLAHGIIIGKDTNNKVNATMNCSATILIAKTNDPCMNPNCKAKKQLTHSMNNLILARWWKGRAIPTKFQPEELSKCCQHYVHQQPNTLYFQRKS